MKLSTKILAMVSAVALLAACETAPKNGGDTGANGGRNLSFHRARLSQSAGFVPEQNLVGKAVRIWLNLDTRDGPLWGRIGHGIQ